MVTMASASEHPTVTPKQFQLSKDVRVHEKLELLQEIEINRHVGIDCVKKAQRTPEEDGSFAA